MSHIASDIRHGVRFWARTPALTLIVIASIGLGLGANTAIFTLVDQVLLRLLPVRDPDELVQVTATGSRYGATGATAASCRIRCTRSCGTTTACSPACSPVRLWPPGGRQGRTERVVGELVSGTYFPVLGVAPRSAARCTPDDDRTPGAHPVAVLSHAYWHSRFARAPVVVGRTHRHQRRSATRSSAWRSRASKASSSDGRRRFACR